MTTVVHILSDSTFSGGPLHVLNLVKGLDKEEYTSLIIGPAGPMHDIFRKEGITTHILTPGSKFQWGRVGELRILLEKTIPREGKSIVHCHGPRAGLFGRLAARSINTFVVYTEHLWTRDYKLKNPINSAVQLMALRYLDQFTTKTIGVSQAVVDFLISARVTPPSKITRIYNGILTPAKTITSAAEPVIGSVGALVEQKNYAWLIEQMPEIQKHIPAARLEIIGDGPQRQELEHLIKNLGLGASVTLVGALSPDQLPHHYAHWALYVQPSLNESFGLALAEAMAAGLPAVASNRGSLPEIIGSAEAVFALEETNAGRELIAHLLQDKTTRDELQAKELAHVRQFSLDAMVKAHADLYASLI